jgi:2-oxoglutarate ferredoxin oxidoreductase subunit alpha
LISIWPFPEDLLRELSETVEHFIIPELNLGQISQEVERVVRRPVKGVHHAGGAMIPPERIVEAIHEVSKWRQ